MIRRLLILFGVWNVATVVSLNVFGFEMTLALTVAIFVHEAGHGLYELGSNQAFERTPLAGGTSLAVHESQSRMWENLVGRSSAFWKYFYPKAQQVFPEALGSTSPDDFHLAINAVNPQFFESLSQGRSAGSLSRRAVVSALPVTRR